MSDVVKPYESKPRSGGLGSLSAKALMKLLNYLDEDIKHAIWRGSANVEAASKALLHYHLAKAMEVTEHGFEFNYPDYADYGDEDGTKEATTVVTPEND